MILWRSFVRSLSYRCKTIAAVFDSVVGQNELLNSQLNLFPFFLPIPDTLSDYHIYTYLSTTQLGLPRWNGH
jgi:hypothetical protein